MSEDKEHFMKCNNCGEDFDLRNLSLVFHHEGDCLNTTVKDIPHSSSKKVGDSILYDKNKKPIHLN